MIKLCVFDFDNTLMDGETITNFAKHMGVGEEVADITNQAMAGNLDFFESFTRRVALVKGMKEEDAKKIAENLPFIEGAKEIITYLKEKGIKVVVFSGGFHIGTDAAQEKLGFDASFANYFHIKDGVVTGKAGGEMMFNKSKGLMLKQLKGLLGLKKEEVMCVGDGANDISMFKEAGLNIAFCAHDILKKEATHVIDKRDLREIKKYV